jgi:hypothetical protein
MSLAERGYVAKNPVVRLITRRGRTPSTKYIASPGFRKQVGRSRRRRSWSWSIGSGQTSDTHASGS